MVSETNYKDKLLEQILWNKYLLGSNGLYINLIAYSVKIYCNHLSSLTFWYKFSNHSFKNTYEHLLCSRYSESVTPSKNILKSIDYEVCTYTDEETKAQKDKSGLLIQGYESQDMKKGLRFLSSSVILSTHTERKKT